MTLAATPTMVSHGFSCSTSPSRTCCPPHCRRARSAGRASRPRPRPGEWWSRRFRRGPSANDRRAYGGEVARGHCPYRARPGWAARARFLALDHEDLPVVASLKGAIEEAHGCGRRAGRGPARRAARRTLALRAGSSASAGVREGRAGRRGRFGAEAQLDLEQVAEAAKEKARADQQHQGEARTGRRRRRRFSRRLRRRGWPGCPLDRS